MKTFIIIQTILTKQEIEGITVNNHWENIVRQVQADSSEVAIGKFVIQTADIVAKEKLKLECYLLDTLKELK